VLGHLRVTNATFRRLLRLEVSQIKGMRTSKQQADLEDKRTSLRNRIYRWREIQSEYMQCVGTLLPQSHSIASASTTAESPIVELSESMLLHLPSSLPQHLRQLPEISTILDKERRLRIAQADDSLADIRQQRRIISGLWQFKKANTNGTGNKSCTRMRTIHTRLSLRTQRCAMRYRASRNALLAIDPHGSWQSRLKDLKDNDIRGPGKDDDGLGNGRYEPSWIWMVPQVSSDPDMGDSEVAPDDSLEVEWAKSRARKERWEEEVLIIQEEMRRVIAYHQWRASWWRDQGKRRTNADSTTLHGIVAYAEKQADLCEGLASICATHWLPVLKAKDITPDWATTVPIMPALFRTIASEDSVGDEGSDDAEEVAETEEIDGAGGDERDDFDDGAGGDERDGFDDGDSIFELEED
jgi:hypothetical protein